MAKKNVDQTFEPNIQEVQVHFKIISKIHDWVANNPENYSYRGAETNLEFVLIKLTKIVCNLRKYRRKSTWGYFSDKEDSLQEDKQNLASLIYDTRNYLDKAYESINDPRLNVIVKRLNRVKLRILNFE